MGGYGAGLYGAGLYGGGAVVVDRAPEPRHKAPGPLTCRVTNQAGQWAYLNAFGKTSGLSFVWGYPGGPQSAQVSVDIAPQVDIPALVQGASFEIIRGASVGWRGKVASITPGTPRQIQVDGLAGLSTREVALVTGSLDDIVDASISNGMPWTRPATLTGGWTTTDVPITTTLDQVLGSGLTPLGKRWTVDNLGAVRSQVDPTGTPTLLIRVTDPAIPVTLNKYVTRVTVHYTDTTSGLPDWLPVINTAAEAKFGRVVGEILLSPYVTYTSTEATAAGQLYLDRVSPRLTLTGSFTVTNGQITTGQGASVDLADIKNISGKLARLQFASPLRDAQLGSVMAFDVVIGECTYDDDNATLSVSPVDAGLTPAQILFGAQGGGDYVSPYA